MILYQNALIVLDYNPSTDILSVEWLNIQPYNLPEIRHTLEMLVESIRNYDVKKLLIDGSKTTVSPELDEAEYRNIVFKFVSDISKTRLQKSARITTPDQVREAKSKQLSAEAIKNTHLTIQSQDFATKSEALEWLMA